MPYMRQEAIRLRQEGWSYSVISDRLKIAKSTLSHWLRGVPFEPNDEMVERIKVGRAKSAAVRAHQKAWHIDKAAVAARNDIKNLTKRDMFMLGLSLYLGEGTKLYEEVKIVNSDPMIMKSAVLWFVSVCGVPRQNLSLALHIYPDISENAAKAYWSGVTGVPLAQYGKTQIDRRAGKSDAKRGKLSFGTAHLRVRSLGNSSCGVGLHRRIMGWIKRIERHLRT